ncbi:adenylate/guanylate cyclase [Rhizobiales bacterium GAS113]|nr:adenylate/guanylate cyclase [Rhizobiales bacterium GAS113]
MRCPACQHESAPGANFCAACGTRLVLTCRACGTELPESARFCLQCGLSVSDLPSAAPPRFTIPESYTPRHLAEPILASKNALEGERKHLTVLFADLKGSMEILADRDPEDSRKILDPVLEYMIEAVHSYEGTVTQVMGDGIMALFGAPLAHEDHGVRACEAALRMQESMSRYGEEIRRRGGIPVQIRVGLNSGEVVVHSIGTDFHMGYTAVGRTTHLAARMEQAATPGSVLLTLDTLRLVEGYVDVRPVGLIAVKGLGEPVEAYELKGIGRVRTRLQAAAARGLTRFVGREAEMEVLGRALEQAATGHGQVISAVGEPGMGKSRLLYEFVHSHRTEDWLILESGSAPHGKAPPGLPVIDLLKSYFRVEVHADSTEIREQVVSKVLDFDRSLEPLVTPLLALLDAPIEDPEWSSLDPPQRLRLSLEALLQLLARESEVQPLLVVFDDLQSHDSVTQSFLDGLVESLPRARIVLLASYRPDYQHRWGSKSYYGQLRLDPLPDESANAMLDALVGGDAQLLPLKRLLIARTEGNPFFIEESVRTLVETGVLGGPRGAYRLVKDPKAIQVPATVEAVLTARIDRLPLEEKRLLQCAAVVGKDVPMALLRTIADMDEDALRRGLAILQAAEFLYVGRLFPGPEYTFKHALTHQVTYGRLLQDRRRALHKRIVETLERAHLDPGAEQVELLAHHAFRGEMWEKAVRYSRQAGVTAASRPAHREAVARFEQALKALEHLPESREQTELAIDIRFDLRNSLHPLGHLERILEHIRKVEAQAALLGDQRRLGQASSLVCQYHRLMGDLGPAIEAGERAMGVADQLSDLQLWILARSHLGPALAARGDHRRATEILTAGVERLRGDLVRDVMGTTGIVSVFSRIYLASSLAELGEFGAAMLHAREAFRIAESVSHVYSLAFAYYGIGTVLVARGEVPGSIAALERGLDLCRSRNLPLMLPLLGTSLGRAYCLAARADEAIGLLEEAERQAVAMARTGGHAMLLVRLGEAYLQVLRVGDAGRCARQALTLSREHTERGLEAHALRLLGELGVDDPPALDESEAFYHQAIARAEELEMRPLLAQCYLGLGVRHHRVGRRTSADSHLNTALALFRALDMPFWLDRAQAHLASPP